MDCMPLRIVAIPITQVDPVATITFVCAADLLGENFSATVP